MIKLTIKQEKFCHKYIECGNASEAYRFAYSCEKMKDKTIWEKSSGLLSEGKVRARVDELKTELAKKSDITKDKVLIEFAKIAFSSIAHLHNTWVDRKAFEDLSDDQKATIKSISTRIRKMFDKSLDMEVEVEEVKIELYDKLKALESINRMLGYDSPKDIKLTINNPFEGVNPLDIADILSQ